MDATSLSNASFWALLPGILNVEPLEPRLQFTIRNFDIVWNLRFHGRIRQDDLLLFKSARAEFDVLTEEEGLVP